MFGLKLVASKAFEKKLDNFSWKEIIIFAVVTFMLLGVLFHFCLLAPLEQKIVELKAQIESLNWEIGKLEPKRASYSKTIPDSVELPESLYNFRAVFEQKSINVKEIVTTQLPTLNKGLSQIAIRVTLYGEKNEIINALLNTESIEKNTFLFEDLDIDDKKAVINFKILYMK